MGLNAVLTKSLRSYLSGRDSQYVFQKFDPAVDAFSFPPRGGLYLHIPFCKNLCPYCPYFKIPYEAEKARQYKEAVRKEIRMYGRMLPGARFTSLYVGGGTPTLMIDELFEIIGELRNNFNFDGPIGLETSPGDITETNLAKLRALGVNLLSVGVQSFQDRFLRSIGRNYGGEEIARALGALKKFKFDTVNFDLIFVLPRQTMRALEDDIRKALGFRPDQITYYPLFTFPYTSIGEYRKLKGLKLPNVFKRRAMYYRIYDVLSREGYAPTSVWSFNRKGTVPYSSVTRDFFLGLGAGAGTYTREGFYFNIFSVEHYNAFLNQEKRLPLALKMNVSERMAKLFWLYWRFYETKVPFEDYRRLFGRDLEEDFAAVFKVVKLLSLADDQKGPVLRLNKAGSHWIHLLQNYFALNYVSKIWKICKDNPLPQQIAI
ncbi:MAG TPA: radical SAM protein [Candidatus Omnitrophota bacterium]|mgnify:CR=1 FL=1|nr:radical SAM protein [Candidatus Omnitrophota bacterium]